jgi:hypothetical protein
MARVLVSADLSTWITERIEEFPGNHEAHKWLADRVHEMDALPLVLDMGGSYAIRASGDLVQFGWDGPEDGVEQAVHRCRRTPQLFATATLHADVPVHSQARGGGFTRSPPWYARVSLEVTLSADAVTGAGVADTMTPMASRAPRSALALLWIARSHGRWSSPSIAILAIYFATAVVACGSAEGGEGEPCKCDNCSLLGGEFYCDPGLICDTALVKGPALYTCQRPQSVPEGGACIGFSSGLCAAGLVCSYSDITIWTCEPPRPCPAGQVDQSGTCAPCPSSSKACDGGVH